MRRPQDQNPERLALEEGRRETRQALHRWRLEHWRILLPWTGGAVAIALLMLLGAWTFAQLPRPVDSDFTPIFVQPGNTWDDFVWIISHNMMVLTMHLLICVAAYLARRAVPMQAKYTKGLNHWVHQYAGPIAMAIVAGLTTYSLCLQAWKFGVSLHAAAHTLNRSTFSLLAQSAFHGLPELTAIFLPLAACLLLGRRKQWNKLLAAAMLCAAVCIPTLLMTAALEVWVTPHV